MDKSLHEVFRRLQQESPNISVHMVDAVVSGKLTTVGDDYIMIHVGNTDLTLSAERWVLISAIQFFAVLKK